MNHLSKKISLLLILFFLCGCSSSSYEGQNRETLKSRLENRTSHNQQRYLLETRSFDNDSLRLTNPEMLFVYFPSIGKSTVTAPRKVRLSMYASVIYRKGF